MIRKTGFHLFGVVAVNMLSTSTVPGEDSLDTRGRCASKKDAP